MDTNRRQFLCGCGIGALGAMTAPARAWADRVRVLGETADVDLRHHQLVSRRVQISIDCADTEALAICGSCP